MKNKKTKIKKQIHDLIASHAFCDEIMAETINTLTRDFILCTFSAVGVPLHYVNVERGEILTDKRGRGSWQHQPFLE